MKMLSWKRSKAMRYSLLVILVLFGLTGVVFSQSKAVPTLSESDCVKCHTPQPADIAAAGGAHQGLGCMGCHAGHRPSSKNNIPVCSQCHSGKPHFDLKDCLGCHKNPHTPKKITFGGTVTNPCVTCHTQQIAQLKEHKSKHSALYCSTCHSVHREKPECTQCHKPHSSGMTASDCRTCHQAHMPTAVAYGADVPSASCGACHQKALGLLNASTAKHSKLACAFCHPEKHKYVPKCEDCHGQPHPAGIHAKFPKCGDCHGIAHSINSWAAAPAPAKSEAPLVAPAPTTPAPAKKKKM